VQASSSGNYIAKEALKNSFVQQSRSKNILALGLKRLAVGITSV
jgi:hypothetical protein